MIGKLLKNSAIYGMAPYVPRIVSIFILPILTKHLTAVDYGIAGTISAYTLALASLSTLGVSAILQVTFFKSPNYFKVLWREVYGFLQYWMVAFAILQAVILYFIMPSEAKENTWLIIIFTNFNTVFFGPSAFLCPLLYQLKQNPIPIAVRSVLSGLLTIIINYVLIVVLEYGYMGWYVSSFLGQFIINIAYWYDLNHKLKITPIYFFKKKTIAHTLKISFPLIPHYYTYFLVNTSNRMVMDRSSIAIEDIGVYNMAQNFSTIFESATGAIEKAISPMCMESIKNGDEAESRRLVYVFSILTFIATFVFAIWSKEIFYFMVKNDDLKMGYPVAALLALSLNYRPMYIGASNIYFYHEKTLQLLYITFGAGILALIGNIIFIPIYGVKAAVIITYVSFLYQGYSGFVFKTYKENARISYPFIQILILQLVVTGIAMFSIETSVVFKILLTLSAILIAVFVLLNIVNFNIRTISNKIWKS